MSTATETDPQSLIASALARVKDIATLPEITTQIIRTVEDPRSSAMQLHKIIAHDPALISRILKVVNSSFYGLPGQVGSVERAIVLLGLNAVKNIAVAASLGQLFRGVKLCDGFTAKDLWAHCAGVAVVAKHLAKELKVPLADEAFLAGMIHDIGLLVELQVWPDQLRAAFERVKNGGARFVDAERELMGVDHQQLGGELAKVWKFPRPCQLVAAYHHQPTALENSDRLLVTLVFIADTLCCQAGYALNLAALHQSLDEGGLGDLQLDPALIERVRTELPTILNSCAGLF